MADLTKWRREAAARGLAERDQLRGILWEVVDGDMEFIEAAGIAAEKYCESDKRLSRVIGLILALGLCILADEEIDDAE